MNEELHMLSRYSKVHYKQQYYFGGILESPHEGFKFNKYIQCVADKIKRESMLHYMAHGQHPDITF